MVRLLTVIGHGTNLLPHFIEHYQKHVDEINIAVYETELHPNLTEEINEVIKNYEKVNVVITVQERVFDWEKVTQLYNFVKSKRKDSWYVIADIDEFHLYTNDDLPTIIKTCDEYGYILVRGGFIDRIGINGEFEDIKSDTSIWEQFPNAGFFRYPLSNANPNKICIKKGHVELTSGQHYAKLDGHTTWRWQGWNHPLRYPIQRGFTQVHHFKWDKSVVDRLKAVAKIGQDYSYSREYQIMLNGIEDYGYCIDLEKYKEFTWKSEKSFVSFSNWNKLSKHIVSI